MYFDFTLNPRTFIFFNRCYKNVSLFGSQIYSMYICKQYMLFVN